MKCNIPCFAFCVLASATAFAQEGAAAQPPKETVAPNIPGVVAAGTKVEVFKIAPTGNTEGPTAVPDGSGAFVFAELAANKVWKVDKDNKITLLVDNTSGALGMGWDQKGRLIATLTTPPGKTGIGVVYPKGQETVLADTCDNKPLGRPNDLVVSSKGAVYFTDPGPSAGQIKQGYTQFGPAVCYIAPGAGKAVLFAEVMGRPNGITLTPDEKTLYVNNSFGEYVIAFDLKPDGTAQGRRNWGKYDIVPGKGEGAGGDPVSVSDGMTIDNAGRVYVANQSRQGIQVFSPKGETLGVIPLGGNPQNLAFAGPDKKTLYATGGGYAFKIRTMAEGIKGRAK